MSGKSKPQARFRVLNASIDLPSIDIEMNGARAFSQVSYGQLTDYVSVAPGQHPLRIYTSANREQVLEVDQSLHSGADYTIAISGRGQNLETMVVKDNTPEAAPGRVRIRLLHLAPELQPVDASIRGGTDIFRNVSYGEVTGFAEVQAGTVDLQVAEAGDSQPGTTIEHYQLQPDGKYTLVVLDRHRQPRTLDVIPVKDRFGRAA